MIEQFMPEIMTILGMVITAVIGFVGKVVFTKFGLEIEEKHRKVLHTAIMAGIARMLKRVNDPNDQITDKMTDEAIDNVVAYVKKTVPDAVSALVPNNDILKMVIKARIPQ